MIRNKKGITLIALVITIIVLLILAGVSLSLVMGDAGILKKAEFATNQTKIEGLKERIQLEIAGSYDNNGRIQLEILKENLKNNLGATNVEGNEYPLKAELEGYFFEITEDLKVIAKIGIEIEQERITFLGGSALSQTVTAKRLNNEEGTITWSTTGNIKLSATEGDSVEVSLGSETQIGDTATITATLGEYSDTIQVKFIDRMNVGDLDNFCR